VEARFNPDPEKLRDWVRELDKTKGLLRCLLADCFGQYLPEDRQLVVPDLVPYAIDRIPASHPNPVGYLVLMRQNAKTLPQLVADEGYELAKSTLRAVAEQRPLPGTPSDLFGRFYGGVCLSNAIRWPVSDRLSVFWPLASHSAA
jgi:hypothetical protein